MRKGQYYFPSRLLILTLLGSLIPLQGPGALPPRERAGADGRKKAPMRNGLNKREFPFIGARPLPVSFSCHWGPGSEWESRELMWCLMERKA